MLTLMLMRFIYFAAIKSQKRSKVYAHTVYTIFDKPNREHCEKYDLGPPAGIEHVSA